MPSKTALITISAEIVAAKGWLDQFYPLLLWLKRPRFTEVDSSSECSQSTIESGLIHVLEEHWNVCISKSSTAGQQVIQLRQNSNLQRLLRLTGLPSVHISTALATPARLASPEYRRLQE